MLNWVNKRLNPASLMAVCGSLLSLAIIYFLYFWRLGTLTSGLSQTETVTRSASSLNQITNNAIYAPYKIMVGALAQVNFGKHYFLRLSGVILALIFIVSYFWLIKSWFGKMVAFFASLIILSSPWLVLSARSASFQILMLAPFGAVSSYYYWQRSEKVLALLLMVLFAAGTLYLPGGFYLILLGVIIARKNLGESLKALGAKIWLPTSLLLLALSSLLIYSLYRTPNLIKQVLLVPPSGHSIISILKTDIWAVLSLVWRTPSHFDYIVGRLPLMNISLLILTFFGGIALYRLAKQKLFLFFGLVLFSVIACGLEARYDYLILAAASISVVVAAGIRYLFIEWKKIFPKNPFPTYLAIFLISIVAGLNVAYGIRYSLAAWPGSEPTRHSYVLK